MAKSETAAANDATVAHDNGHPASRRHSIPLPDQQALPAHAIERMGDDPDFVTALARGLAVLQSLSEKRRRISIAQVSHLTGIPRAAARRSLHTLVKLGFAGVDEHRRFYLRPRVLTFSHAYLSASPIAMLAQPVLDRLGEAMHEACSLATLDGDEISYLARSASSRIISPQLNVGRRLPAYCTSIGHVLLAHLPAEELDLYLARVRFHPYTAHTPRLREELLALLQGVRDSGFAYASQLMELRLCTFAVPVRDTGGNYVAGINVILPGRLMSRSEMASRYYQPLQEAEMELGSLLLP
jgi:IclR family transcriptional regulator, pca regulon regulatory protein